jgi:hypothetical protein
MQVDDLGSKSFSVSSAAQGSEQSYLVSSLVSNQHNERAVVQLDIIVNENRYSRVQLLAHRYCAPCGTLLSSPRSSLSQSKRIGSRRVTRNDALWRRRECGMPAPRSCDPDSEISALHQQQTVQKLFLRLSFKLRDSRLYSRDKRENSACPRPT